MTQYCIDASALVIYITGQRSTTNIKKQMLEIESGRSKGFLSVVNLAEFHRAVSRIFSIDKADMYVSWIKESKINIISPSFEIATLASMKRQKYAISGRSFTWGDAFCLATALEKKANYIITSDKDFEQIREIEVIFV